MKKLLLIFRWIFFLITDENCLKTIIRNLTSNAIKATSSVIKPEIRWTSFSRDNIVALKISAMEKSQNIQILMLCIMRKIQSIQNLV